MQRDRVDMKPILDFEDLGCVKICVCVCSGEYCLVECLGFNVDIDGARGSR